MSFLVMSSAHEYVAFASATYFAKRVDVNMADHSFAVATMLRKSSGSEISLQSCNAYAARYIINLSLMR